MKWRSFSVCVVCVHLNNKKKFLLTSDIVCIPDRVGRTEGSALRPQYDTMMSHESHPPTFSYANFTSYSLIRNPFSLHQTMINDPKCGHIYMNKC